VAFLALPDVGAAHANGHLLGLAVAVPELPVQERAAVLRAVLGLRDGGKVVLSVPRLGEVTLTHEPGLVRPWGATTDRWLYESVRWASATPVVLDRFPKNPDRIAEEVRSSMRRVGLPEPVDVQVSARPLLPGAVDLRPSDLPKRAQGRLFCHLAVVFDRPVTGPLLVGAGRYLGVGLLAPQDRARRD
jgi:CRISPR-associated protein Csb2